MPIPYQPPEATVHAWISEYQLVHPGELPKLAWLMHVTGLAMGTVAKYRKTYSASPPKKASNLH